MIEDYIILEDEDRERLVYAVKCHISSGWIPQGGVSMYHERSRSAGLSAYQKYAQAMIKHAPTDNNRGPG